MIVTGVTKDQLDQAMDKVSSMYDGNIVYKRCDAMSSTGKRWQVTLTVKSSKCAGHTFSLGMGYARKRRIAAACWHVHGKWMELLPVGSKVTVSRSTRRTIEIGKDYIWEDFNVGSIMYPLYASEACECNE